MGDRFYRVVRWFGQPFRFRVMGAERVCDLPALFVGNHLGSLGPIQAILSLPYRLCPWVIADMADRRLAPAYLRKDFVEPAWHLHGLTAEITSAVVAQIAVSLIQGLGSVPVTKRHGLFDGSFRESLALLAAGKSLLIFPEDPDGPLQADTGMRPFLSGFGWLCYLHDRSHDRPVAVYPFAVHSARAVVAIGKPQYLAIEGERRERVRLLCHNVERDIAALSHTLDRGATKLP